MDFLKRLLSVGGKRKRKDRQKRTTKKSTNTLSDSLPIPHEQDAVDEDILVNRLLRSSSTHFSVISEGTEYRSMPPIPHPINHVLRAPSIKSSATQADTYSVTVHSRMLHSRTEFPNANRSRESPSSPPILISRRQSMPPLTPGDKNRLARLRQDASVLSLLDIYDEKGNPNSRAFSNTPAKSDRYDASLRALMGSPSTPNLSPAAAGLEESDISWAERQIRAARDDSSSSSSSTTSSLGIPINLFKTSLSPERLRLHEHDSETIFSSCDIDVGIDSLVVERGTVEDASAILQPLTAAAALTSPARRASQFFNFLEDKRKLHEQDCPNPTDIKSPENESSSPPSQSLKLPPPLGRPRAKPSSTAESPAERKPISWGDTDLLTVRDGPKESRAQVSPPPRRRSHPTRLPPVPAQMTTPNEQKLSTFGPRAPFEALHNADVGGPSTRSVSIAPTTRSVSVASSVHPEIETQSSDPYTPVPSRRYGDARSGHGFSGENVPPNAPARPVRGQSRVHSSLRMGLKASRNKQNVSVSSKPMLNENRIRITPDNSTALASKELPFIPIEYSKMTPPSTPPKNPTHARLQAPLIPSPASSSELSPQGRRMMADIREKARNAGQSKTPRLWQSWLSKNDSLSM